MTDLPEKITIQVVIPSIIRDPMPGYVRIIPTTTTIDQDVFVCPTCAALVLDPHIHARTHGAR